MAGTPLDRTLARSGVARGPAPEAAAFLRAARAQGLRGVVVDLGGAASKPAMLRRLAEALAFPEDFGMNLDALNDSLADLVLAEEGAGLALLLTGWPAQGAGAAAARGRPAAEAILAVLGECASALAGRKRRLVVLAP